MFFECCWNYIILCIVRKEIKNILFFFISSFWKCSLNVVGIILSSVWWGKNSICMNLIIYIWNLLPCFFSLIKNDFRFSLKMCFWFVFENVFILGSRLGKTDHHRQTRPRRPVQVPGLQGDVKKIINSVVMNKLMLVIDSKKS